MKKRLNYSAQNSKHLSMDLKPYVYMTQKTDDSDVIEIDGYEIKMKTGSNMVK